MRGEPIPALTYPARFMSGGDGRILVEFVDLPRVATDGGDDREAMGEATDALARISQSGCPAGKGFPRLRREAWSAPGATAALAGAETGALPGDARPASEQLRVGAPPRGPRASNPPYARSRARVEGGKNPSPRGIPTVAGCKPPPGSRLWRDRIRRKSALSMHRRFPVWAAK